VGSFGENGENREEGKAFFKMKESFGGGKRILGDRIAVV
jgi:hypothetical protein